MKSAFPRLVAGFGIAAVLGLAPSGCSKFTQKSQADSGKSRAESKRQQEACASPAAYDRVKGDIFDQAIRARNGDRANLDTLADYSQARMEQPLVEGRDPVLDLTRCKGRLVLEVPPGAERGLGGERRLQAEITYNAQAAADGSGLVYKVEGAEPLVAQLAAFNLSGRAYRPPPAIDDPAPEQGSTTLVQKNAPWEQPIATPRRAPAAEQKPVRPAVRSSPEAAPSKSRAALPDPYERGTGEGTVRAFYDALARGNGTAASALIIPEKRSNRTYAPEAISQFYGRLPEPIRLIGISALSDGAYRVRYAYSAGRSRCNSGAVVRVTNRGGRNLISSIQALNGC